MNKITFGTDGWRALMDKDFNTMNVEKVMQAFCDMQKNNPNKLIYIGFDRRKNSDIFAKQAAQILSHNGFQVRLTQNFCPTPCVSWLVKKNSACAGIMITASHNPANWNGIKFKESYGGAASTAYTQKIESFIHQTPTPEIFTDTAGGTVEIIDPNQEYSKHLQSLIKTDVIAATDFKIIVDPLYGAGTNFIKNIMATERILQIHDAADVNFGGLHPEPVEKNLTALKEAVLKNQAQIGIATDGDADRVGAIDEKGHYVSSHEIFALLLLHHIRFRQLTGPVIKSISTTQLINKICQKYQLEICETAIGFKNICSVLLEKNALMGGEESGGISFRDHVHERDGILSALFLIEMIALHQKTLSQLIEEMHAEFGQFFFKRKDYHVPQDFIKAVNTILENDPYLCFNKKHIQKTSNLDGLKINFNDDSWLLIRPSGTEPLLRVYAEAKSEQRVEELLATTTKFFELSEATLI